MPYAAVPTFVKGLRAKGTASARALELIILTGLRSVELLSIRWEWIDWEKSLLTIPAEFMKGGTREHVVPLTRRALELLRIQLELTGVSGYVFPGQRDNGHMVTSAFRTCGLGKVTVHGFRSSLRQFLADAIGVEHWVAEGVLAHSVKGVEGAYQREQSLEKHGAALKAWADWIG